MDYFVCHILDDFLVIEPPSPIAPHNLACQQNLSSMLLTSKNLGIPTAPHKTQGPSTTLEFMGIVLDSDRMEARLPPDKVQGLTSCFTEFKGRRSCTLKELVSYWLFEFCLQGYSPGPTIPATYDSPH